MRTASSQQIGACSAVVLLVLAALLAGAPVAAQGTRIMPGPSYFAAIEELYSAKYRQADRGFRSELRGAIQTVDTRWLDSICYHAMLGEVLYQAGENGPALEQLDYALLLFLDNADWLQTVSFQKLPQRDAALARRVPPWALPNRRVIYGEVPRSFLVQVGRVNNTPQANQGGVVRQAQFWKLDAQELARTIGWAIYRRGHLLGPLAPHDPLQKRVVDTLSRGRLGKNGHWTGIWVELWWGLAAASVGDAQSAKLHLERATLLPGGLDHRLTGLALLGLGQVAHASGDPAAGTLLREALVAAIPYEDLSVLGEAAHLLTLEASLRSGLPPSVDFALVSEWARRGGLAHVSAATSLAETEQLLNGGQYAIAQKQLAGLFGRRGEAKASRLGPQGALLAARAHALSGNPIRATTLLVQATEAQQRLSLQNFQTWLANTRLDNGTLSPRLANDIYRTLLSDPTPLGWAKDPLDVITSLRTDQTETFDRWFALAISRRDVATALTLVDLQRRRKFYQTRPYAGRLVSTRRLLEAADPALTKDERTTRAMLEDRMPVYAENREQGSALCSKIAMLDGLLEGSGNLRASKNLFEQYAETLRVREGQLRKVALSRSWLPMTFPPPLELVEGRKALAPGEVVLVLHESRGEFYGLLLATEGENLWRLGPSASIEKSVVALLRQTAGASGAQRWTAEQLALEAWKSSAEEMAALWFDKSRIDTTALKKLTVVPDGILWHVPVEMLPIGSEQRRLIDTVPVRISPTAGLALAPRGERRPIRHVAVLGAEVRDKESSPDPLLKNVAGAVAVPINTTLPQAVIQSVADRLVIDADRRIDPEAPDRLEPIPLGRKNGGGLAAWRSLPYGSPDCVVFSSLHTQGEQLPKLARRGSAKRLTTRPGDALFHATCSLLASGSRTLLLSRWVTDGERHRDLISEFLIGLSREGAPEAWQRSVALARPIPLRVSHEPRVEPLDDAGETAIPTAEHPFFWGAYLLVD